MNTYLIVKNLSLAPWILSNRNPRSAAPNRNPNCSPKNPVYADDVKEKQKDLPEKQQELSETQEEVHEKQIELNQANKAAGSA
ncbi:MAG: hypothetical protein KGZ69_13015 [Methylomonas sp.]|nr:hypothetical protein [Methylomonas sp.]